MITTLASRDGNREGDREMLFGAVLTLHASSLQHVVQAEVPLDVVMPFSHSVIVSFTCRPHDTFIVHILLIDSFSLTSDVYTHTTSPPSSTRSRSGSVAKVW